MPTPALRKVDSIMYKVKDLAISEAFYTDVMGMPVIDVTASMSLARSAEEVDPRREASKRDSGS